MTEKRFENRLNKDIKKFHALNPVWDNELKDAWNVFEMIDLLNNYDKEYKSCLNDVLRLEKENDQLKEENKKLKKQLRREETDKKRLMTLLMKYKSYSFDEIVENILDEPYYDTWWENGFYEFCWDEYLKEKGFDGCDEE